jgi:hypothetical protein
MQERLLARGEGQKDEAEVRLISRSWLHRYVLIASDMYQIAEK